MTPRHPHRRHPLCAARAHGGSQLRRAGRRSRPADAARLFRLGDPPGRRRNGGHPPVIVDTGFGEEAAAARGRTHHPAGDRGAARCRDRPLAGRGRDPDASALRPCRLARPVSQRQVPCPGRRARLRHQPRMCATTQTRAPFDGEPVAQLVRKLYADRVVFHDGDDGVRPGDHPARLPPATPPGCMVVCCETRARHRGARERRRASLRQHHPQAALPDLRRRGRISRAQRAGA